MKKEINLEVILRSSINGPSNVDLQTLIDEYSSPWDILNAMHSACKQTLELASENAFASPVYDRDILTDACIVNKQSILNTLKQLEFYERN